MILPTMNPEIYFKHGDDSKWIFGPVERCHKTLADVPVYTGTATLGFTGALESGVGQPPTDICVFGKSLPKGSPSTWHSYPPPCIWNDNPTNEYRGKHVSQRKLVVYVNIYCLDWSGSAFEYRHKARQSGKSVEADREGEAWPDTHKEFVPFETPHPHGYRGVHGVFCNFDEDSPLSLTVVDEFTNGVHRLVMRK